MDAPTFEQYRLSFRPSSLSPLPPEQDAEEVRLDIRSRLLAYAQNPSNDSILLIRVPPGVGKTTASVQAAQEWTQRTGKRLLYVSSRKNFFEELMTVPGADRSLWYDWKSLDYVTPDGVPYCQYAAEMAIWIRRGYKSMDMCRQLCQMNGHIASCPYRMQKGRPERIIFGRHAHLITGMAIRDFELGICDEMPMAAFLKTQHVPRSLLAYAGNTQLEKFSRLLRDVSETLAHEIYGPTLLGMFCDTLRRIYEYDDALGITDIAPPYLGSPEQVRNVPCCYLLELVRKIKPEFEQYEQGDREWIPRVYLGPAGLTMIGRSEARAMWRGGDDVRDDDSGAENSGAEKRAGLVCLDATGSERIYELLFRREVEIFHPNVRREGRIFQVCGRLYGAGTVLDRNEDSVTLKKAGKEMLETAKIIAAHYQKVGVVTFKAIEPIFQAEFGKAQVLHFGALRGSNVLQDCDCLIVAGGYAPNMAGLLRLAAQVHERRMKPFFIRQDENGRPLAAWYPKLCEYRFTNSEGLSAWRPVQGYWGDDDLMAILDELRRNEMMQAIHRSRPINHPTDVWILSSLPTDERLDGIWDTIDQVQFPFKISPGRKQVETENGLAWRGISWRSWLKISEWMDQQWSSREYLTAEDLAQQAGTTPQFVRSEAWIAAIDEFFKWNDHPHSWMMAARRIGDSTRPTRVLIPVEK